MNRLGWAFSLLDRQAHAVDPEDDHPLGVWIALCGHHLLAGELSRQPFGPRCPPCAGLTAPGQAPALRPPAAASGTSILRRIETGGVLTRWERTELALLVRFASSAARLVADLPGDVDRTVWLTGAWEPVRRQITRLLRAEPDHD